MEPWQIILIGVAAFLLLTIGFFMAGSYAIYAVLLKRTSPDKWGHKCSKPDDPEIAAVFNGGAAFRERYADVRTSAYIENDGLRLYGEYFDFGHDRTVILLAGRMECCIYSCYFAEPYRQDGYNVFVADMRAHGLSEGKYNAVGYREYRDILAWGRWLHEEKGNRSIVLHGICIGACTSIMAITDESCPDYFTAIAVEGMFDTFYHSTKNHMKADKRPLFPFLYLIMFYIRIISGVNVVTDGPCKRIEKLRRPILFLHGRLDIFSEPAVAEDMYARCTADKRLVWFDRGGHSRLRINNTEAYDRAVHEFLTDLDGMSESARSHSPAYKTAAGAEVL